jgi:hypothetical protein
MKNVRGESDERLNTCTHKSEKEAEEIIKESDIKMKSSWRGKKSETPKKDFFLLIYLFNFFFLLSTQKREKKDSFWFLTITHKHTHTHATL